MGDNYNIDSNLHAVSGKRFYHARPCSDPSSAYTEQKTFGIGFLRVIPPGGTTCFLRRGGLRSSGVRYLYILGFYEDRRHPRF